MLSDNKSPIVGMFLSQFDMKKGNIIIWQENCNNFKNLEFKALPSGIHESNDDVVNFMVVDENHPTKLYHGISYFRQNSFDQDIRENGQVDRSQVKMYSLGLIIETDVIEIDNYVADLEQLLTNWLATNNFNNFDMFSHYYTNRHTQTSDQLKTKKMIEYLPFWMTKLGPLIFTVWKTCLLNKRIIILNPAGGSFDMCNSLALCISKLSDSCSATNDLTPQELLYTIGTIDLDNLKNNNKGYIACTSDEVLIYREEIYDIVIRLPAIGSLEDMIEPGSPISIQDNKGNELRATPHDLETFTFFFGGLIEDTLMSTQIHTQTEPLSWLQFLIDNFYFWLTAGTIKPGYYQDLLSIGSPIEPNGINHILEYFAEKTKLLYKNLELLLSTGEHILSPSDLLQLELDCFSYQDYHFVEFLALRWFQKSITVRASTYWRLL
ncbi:similar to Saccharomyces cerevisiae YKL047W ANR2 Putative protein of unknown function, predicted to be palmitoylated [Maudiozyma saulgeensis]|uniref:DUF4484 domain-containing protein n=1 Tax=Maudiozyma saulgeensis TaxID=1789683 RepID=A0A1X7QX42_9SACH|nr:similar to Saccharomyces cerevisiae YKL047W ANR2 Putative protein of unknown function, predicted to be palmitoylated [Kazachstania saulgeensis]